MTLTDRPEVTVRTRRLQVTPGSPVFLFDGSDARIAEQYRITRTKILHDPRQPRMILVSSAAPRDGKTITSINLAGILAAKPDVRVVLIDADLHHTHIGSLLGFSDTPGLSDLLCGTAKLEEVLVQVEQYPNLFVLPGGSAHTGASDLLDSPTWRDLCGRLRREFSYVVVDSPPMGLFADFELLRSVSDGVVIVVRPDQTDKAECKKALEALEGRKLLGVVLNGVEDWPLHRASNSSYYEQYGRSGR